MTMELLIKSYDELMSIYHELALKIQESKYLLEQTVIMYRSTLAPIKQLLEMQLNISLSRIVSDTLDYTAASSGKREAPSTFLPIMGAPYSHLNMPSTSSTFSNRNAQDPFLQAKNLLHKEDRLREEEIPKVMHLLKIKTAALKKLLTDSRIPQKEKFLLVKALKEIPYPAFISINYDFLSFSPPVLVENLPNDIAVAFEHYDCLAHYIDDLSEKQLITENCIWLYTFLIEDMEHYLQWYKKTPDQQYNLLRTYIISGERTLGIKSNNSNSTQSPNVLHQYVSSAEKKINIQKRSDKTYNDVLLTTFSSIVTLTDSVNVGERKYLTPDIVVPLLSIFSKEHTFLEEACSHVLGTVNESVEVNDEHNINITSSSEHEMILNRHHSLQDQRRYDERYGLTPVSTPSFRMMNTNIFFQHHGMLRNSMSQQQENDDIIVNRHRSPEDQRRYDEKWGLITVL